MLMLWRQQVTLKRRYKSIGLYGIMFQKNLIFLTTLRKSQILRNNYYICAIHIVGHTSSFPMIVCLKKAVLKVFRLTEPGDDYIAGNFKGEQTVFRQRDLFL
jgi:hypothetical protein